MTEPAVELTFRDRLDQACRDQASHLCVGLDPVPESLPEGFEHDADEVLRFTTAIIEATAEFAVAYKPNSAFYEALGPPGMEVLQATIAAVPERIPVILDAKRGDVGRTAERYAHAAFVTLGAAAVTVNPYLGRDSIEPFTAYHDRGVFVVCRTSNSSAAEFLDLTTPVRPLYLEVARHACQWNTHGNVGLVAGATWPREVAEIRAVCRGMPLLLPGIGAQGGDLTAAVRAAAGEGGEEPFLAAPSRAVMFAGSGADYQHAAAEAARGIRDQVEAAREI